jgi:hypothetical protein
MGRAERSLRLLPTGLLLTALAGCSTGSSTSAPSDGGKPHDATTTKDSGSSDAETDGDAGVAPGDSGPLGSCTVRPQCEACIKEAGVCCIYPNPVPPPGPENKISCEVCPVDASALWVTLTCNDETDCPSGDVCCIEANDDAGGKENSFCAAACDPRQNQFQLCNSNAATTACSPHSPCSRNNIDDWNLAHCYGTCGGVGPPRDQ